MAKPSRTRSVEPEKHEEKPRAHRVRRVLVLADGEKNEVAKLVGELQPWLEKRVDKLILERDVRAFYQREQAKPRISRDERPDVVVVLGGDGAILAAVRTFAHDPVPTLGINFGRVGFLASAETSQWQAALTEVLEGRAVIEPRMRLAAELVSQGKESIRAVALNDVVVTRGAFQGMLAVTLKVGADWVTHYRADGLIVATPSGSTAYSLAAGGPILAPSMQGLVVTPICPQALSHRPIVLGPEAELSLSITGSSGLTTLVVDGQGFYPMHQGDEVRLRRHAVAYPLLSRPGHDPFQRLRDRLGWRGSFEPDVFPGEAGRAVSEPDRREPELDTGAGGVL